MAREITQIPKMMAPDRRIAILMILFVVAAFGIAVFLYLGPWPVATVSDESVMSSTDLTSRSQTNRVVNDLEVPATLIARTRTEGAMGQGQDGTAKERSALGLKQPSDAAAVGDRYFILDSGNGRLVEVDSSGNAVGALDNSADEQLTLRLPMAMTAHGESLYVADSGSHRIVVVNPAGRKVEKVIPLAKGNNDQAEPRPIGIAVATNGDVFVADADNQRVLRYQSDGTLSSFMGTGKRDSGEYGLNSPGSLTFDRDGNLYVVDILNSRVMKYSPEGKFLLQVGKAGDTAGSFSRPKGVAVDDKGNIYVSDGLQAAVQVFDRQGQYVGVIGRTEPGNKDSESLFSAPAELKIAGNRLYVTDRLAGLFVFDLGG